MRLKPFSGVGRHYHNYSQRSGTSMTYGNQSRGQARNFKLEINKNNELTVIPTGRLGLKKQQAINIKHKEILSNYKKTGKVRLKIREELDDNKFHARLSKEARNKITEDICAKNIDVKKLLPSDDMGLMLHENGRRYIKVNKFYAEVKEVDGYAFIIKNKGGVIHIEYINGQIHLESYRIRLIHLKKQGFSGRITKPDALIATRLNISKEKDNEILSKYEFPDGSQLYTKETFALSVKDTGIIPEWAQSFEKIETKNHVSPFRENHIMDNELIGFHGKDGCFYRVDSNSPETVLKNGFSASDDYSAIPKMLPGNMDGVIVSRSLEGAQRYQLTSKNSHIYKIKGENIEGVSLIDDLYPINFKMQVSAPENDREFGALVSPLFPVALW